MAFAFRGVAQAVNKVVASSRVGVEGAVLLGEDRLQLQVELGVLDLRV